MSGFSHPMVRRSDTVAAPDHKVRQCFQWSALFLGRADGGSEGPERGAGAAKPRGVGFGLGGAPV